MVTSTDLDQGKNGSVYQISNIHAGFKTGLQFQQIFLCASHMFKSKWTETLESSQYTNISISLQLCKKKGYEHLDITKTPQHYLRKHRLNTLFTTLK